MSALSLDIETAVSEAIDKSIRETFEMMIGQELEHLSTSVVSPEKAAEEAVGPTGGEITVVVGLSGGLQGSVSVCLSKEAALLWTKQLIDHETDFLDQTVIDAIGELGNMVVGGAKGRLEDFSLTIGLPCVMLAGKSRLAFPSSCVPRQLQYSVAGHTLTAFTALIQSNL